MRSNAPAKLATWAIPVVALLALAIVAPSAAASDWGILIFNDHVAIGTPAVMEVFGPSNGSFVLSLLPPPWNGVPAVYSQQFTIPSSATGTGLLNVSLPTAPLGQAEYILQLSVGGVVENQSPLWLLPSYNDTWLNQSFQEFLQNAAVYQEIVHNQGVQISNDNLAILQLRYTLVALIVGVAAWETHKWMLEHNPRYLRRSRSWWQRVGHGPPDHILPANPNDSEDLVAPPVPGAWYVGKWSDCSLKPWLENSIRRHVVESHADTVGPSGPVLGTHYFVWDEEKRRVERYYRDRERAPSLAQRVQRGPVNLTEVVGGE